MSGRWVLATFATASLAACDGGSPTDVPDVAAITLTPTEAALLVGDTSSLTARVVDDGGTVIEGVTVLWSVATPDVVTLSPAGAVARIEALRAGTARVRAAAGGRSTHALVTVTNPAPTISGLVPASAQAGSGGFVLVVTGSRFVDGSVVTWNGSARTTAFVDPTEVHAFISGDDVATSGTVQVRVTTPPPGGGSTVAWTFTVTPPPPPPVGPVASVEIGVDSLRLEEGGTLQLTAVARDADGRVVTGRFVGWTSADPEVVSLDALGGATGIRSGATTVSARVDGVTATIPARITANYPYDLVYSGWDGTDVSTLRILRTNLSDPERTAVRIGPDAPVSGGILSPDGSKLAWMTEFTAGSRAIMVANVNGTGSVELVRATDVSCGRITWSPDGTRVAFACAIGDTDRDIWVASVDGSELTNLTEGFTGHQEWPSWSPVLPGGGSRIAFVQYVAGLPSVWSMGEDGSDPVRVTSGADDQPAWSPDGTSIAFRRFGTFMTDLWTANAAGGSERPLVAFIGHQDEPAWSPDGRLVAFVSNHATFGSGAPPVRRLYTIWADGSKPAQRAASHVHTVHPSWLTR